MLNVFDPFLFSFGYVFMFVGSFCKICFDFGRDGTKTEEGTTGCHTKSNFTNDCKETMNNLFPFLMSMFVFSTYM